MPFKKRFRKRRPVRKVRLPEKKQPIWKKMMGIGTSVADKIALLPGPIGIVGKVLSGIGNMINVETKYSDTALSLTPDNATGTVTLLTALAQGSSDVTRNGNSVLSKSIDLRFVLISNGMSSNTYVRVMLLIDKNDGKGTAPTNADILQSVNYYSYNNQDTSDRFVKLKDELILLSKGTNTNTKLIEWHNDLSDLHIKYDGSAASQANSTFNHIYLAMVSNESTNTPQITGTARFKFMDN